MLTHSVTFSELNQNEKIKLLNVVEQDGKPLHYNSLYFAISKLTPNWLGVLDDINQALYIFSNSGETERLINTVSEGCAV